MIVRMPLPPWSSASHSIAKSQTCQNGLAHLPATKAKSICLMPVAHDEVDEQVPEDEHEQHDAGQAHEEPAVELAVAGAAALAARAGRLEGGGGLGGGGELHRHVVTPRRRSRGGGA